MGSIGSHYQNKAAARNALAQGEAAKNAYYRNASNTEEEAKSANHAAARNMQTARTNQNTATAAMRTRRGASGVTSEGTGMTGELAAATVLEKQIIDMGISAAVADQSRRHEAAMQRWQGDATMTTAINQANQYKAVAKGALLSAGIEAAGTIAGGVAGGLGTAGVLSGAMQGYGLSSMVASSIPGSGADPRMGIQTLANIAAASEGKPDYGAQAAAAIPDPFRGWFFGRQKSVSQEAADSIPPWMGEAGPQIPAGIYIPGLNDRNNYMIPDELLNRKNIYSV